MSGHGGIYNGPNGELLYGDGRVVNDTNRDDTMMKLDGRWITRNKTLVGVHLNPAALSGNREERCIGHTILEDSEVVLKICWNENGECVWVQGIVCPTRDFDLMERITGKDRIENSVKVIGCKECEG